MPEQEAATLEMLSDLCTPWLIHVVATLRIANHIDAGIDQIDALAAAAGCDRYALHRALTSLADKGVFEEPAPGRFVLNKVSRGLLDPRQRIGLDLHGIGGRMAYAWGTLLKYVRTGKPAYHIEDSLITGEGDRSLIANTLLRRNRSCRIATP